MEKAIAGPLAGEGLSKMASTRTTWKTWTKKHPHTLVLSTDTGYRRNYSQDPYEGYYRVADIWFPVGNVRKDLSPKEMVLGIEIKGQARAYPVSILRQKPGTVKDKVNETLVQIVVNTNGQVIDVMDDLGNTIPHIFSYWFAWQAFNPKTSVYRD
jgi:hypothetical protein